MAGVDAFETSRKLTKYKKWQGQCVTVEQEIEKRGRDQLSGVAAQLFRLSQ